MDNLIFTHSQQFNLPFGQPIKISNQQATKTITILDAQYKLHFLQYSSEPFRFHIRKSTQPIQQLLEEKVVLLEYLVDVESVLVLTQNGAIMTITESGSVDIKAQNDDGISGGSLSPAQQHIYVVTKNNTLIQLDMEFDLVKQVPLDDHQTQKVDSFNPKFSWKADGSFFAINIMTDRGRKCHTRDHMLGIFRSPSRSDLESEGLVQSVSQKSRLNMSPLVAWQPSAGIIAGSDYINKNGKKLNRVIFWQKNGLRHLEFQLPQLITDVLNLTWSLDSQILAVEVLLINSTRWLYLYYRSNYYWYLKSTIQLQFENTQYFLTKSKRNQIIILDKEQIQVIQFAIAPTSSSWKSENQQKQNQTMLQASINGLFLKITDFSQGVIPPPLCHHQANFQSNIHAIALHGNHILVFAQQSGWVCRWNGENLDQRKKLSFQKYGNISKIPVNIKFLSIQPNLQFAHSDWIYQISAQGSVTKTEKIYEPQPYYYHVKQSRKEITAEIKDGSLFVNHQTYAEHCTSFVFYHEFLIFTVASSGMYDKMFILDLVLDDLNQVKDSIKMRLEEFESKKLLNYRAIQRGAKIVSCSKNRVIFQLPRGNLEGIYPKVITIKYVKKCMEQKLFKQAFETIRTHKLDLNLLYDIDPKTFTQHAQQILLGIKRTDYLNLFVSQLKDELSSQLRYCNTQQQIDEIQDYIEVNIQGKKINEVCSIVSKTLRNCGKDRFILSIFTSEIKIGMLDDVLFEIKEMKKDDKEEIIPPHLQNEGEKKSKKQLSPQEILEYVCWLVDANVIYEASLLTYDLDLASMTARCTQMDPKQYIPYLEELKTISDPVELKRRICMDLKKHEKAIEELSQGNEQQIRDSIELIKKYKLFKCGLKSYKSKPNQLKQVKLIVIDELLSKGENNQAYKLCLSIAAFDRALQIATKLTDGQKIKQVLENLTNKTREERQAMAKKIIGDLGEQGFKNKNDLAKLKAYVGQYNEATTLYIRAGNYQKAYKYYARTTQQYKYSGQFINGMALLHSLQKNQLIKQKSQFIQKSARLHKVHKHRAVHGFPSLAVRNMDNDDLYSQVSASSKTGSSYTVSTTTGLRKKKDKKRGILSRNVKEGSPLEEEYLVAFLVDLLNKVQLNIKQTKLLIQHLIYANMIEEAESLRNICKQYAEVASKCNPKFYAQIKFQNDHPEFGELLEIYENKGVIDREKGKDKKEKYNIQSFNYMF